MAKLAFGTRSCVTGTGASPYFTLQRTLCMMRPEAAMHRCILMIGLGAALLVVGACHEQPPDSPLIRAARTGSLDTITLLLDAGADVDLAGPTGDGWDATPLQHAIWLGSLARSGFFWNAAPIQIASPARTLRRRCCWRRAIPILLSSTCCSPTEQTPPPRTSTESRPWLVRSPPAPYTDRTARCSAAVARTQSVRCSRTIPGCA